MKIKGIVALGGVLLLAASPAWSALGVHGAGNNPCRVCHNTASGTPALRGWAGTVPTTNGADWSTRALSGLCYGCHDSGGGAGIPDSGVDSAHNMVTNAFDANYHGNVWGEIPEGPDEAAATLTHNLPYKTGNMECTSCHNVHNDSSVPFNQKASVTDLCNTCHPGRQNGPSPLLNALNIIPNFPGQGSTRTYSTHPTAVANANDAAAGINIKSETDVQATDVANPFYSGGAGTYVLGGHLVGGDGTTGNVDCGTCHAVHGPVWNNGGPSTAVNDLLAIDNTTSAALGSRLCNACHEGGAGSLETVGLDNGTATYGDHPIDNHVGSSFYPPIGVAIPDAWTQTPGGRLDRGAQPFSNNGLTPACSSCHDTHGGISASSLMQHGLAGTGVTFDYDIWCWECHTQAGISPNNHHSNKGNWTSQVICNDCHGTGSAWTAHNGFWSFPSPGTAGLNGVVNYQGLCTACHTASNPRYLIAPSWGTSEPLDNGVNAFPATHGTLRAGAAADAPGSSHQVGTAMDSTTNLNRIVRTDVWTISGGTSKWGAGNEILCESCHNLINNGAAANRSQVLGWQANLLLQAYEDDGAGATGGPEAANDFFGADYAPGTGNTGDALCRGCHTPAVGNPANFVHNPRAHTIPDYTYAPGEVPYARATPTILASPAPTAPPAGCPDKTTADFTGAPGQASYAGLNGSALNCDSCHRPHNADDNSASDGRYLVLENATYNGNAAPGTAICFDCHDAQAQCN